MSHVQAGSGAGFARWWAVVCLVALVAAIVSWHAVNSSEAATPRLGSPARVGPTVRPPPSPPALQAPTPGPDRRAKAPTARLRRHRVVELAPSAERWHHVLEHLSRIRARAWRSGQPQLLRRVYDPAALELRRDQAMLRRYAARGLTVRGAQLAFGPVVVASRAPGVVRLRVVDQLRAAVAVDSRGRRLSLPRDSPSRHLIVLGKKGRGWRIASVTDLAW